MAKKKDHLVHKRFQLPKGCSVHSFVIREIDGEDEKESARWLAVRGTKVEDQRLAVMDEQLRVSIVAVDDQTIEQPYLGMDKWNSKTRRLLLEAWGMLNMVEEDEVAAFLGTATEPGNPSAVEILDEEKIAAQSTTE